MSSAHNLRKTPTRLITDFSNITQDDPDEAGPETTEFDLGTKIKTPKDVMLEELSLLNNKGSRMFQMRQQRVERFIYESSADLFSEKSTLNSQNLVPSLGEEIVDLANGVTGEQAPEQEAKEPEQSEKEQKSREYVKTYVSPWERAMRGDGELLATMAVKMPGPHVHCDPPKLKSFNRTALPFGGFEKSSAFPMLQPPEITVPMEPEVSPLQLCNISLRPSFNRTPIGWICSGEPSHIHMELDTIPFDGETDEL